MQFVFTSSSSHDLVNAGYLHSEENPTNKTPFSMFRSINGPIKAVPILSRNGLKWELAINPKASSSSPWFLS